MEVKIIGRYIAKKSPKMSSHRTPTGSFLEIHSPPATPNFQDFGDMTGNLPWLSCTHLWGKLLLTRLGLILILQPHSLQYSFLLSPRKSRKSHQEKTPFSS